MKKIALILVMALSMCSVSKADCDWKTGIIDKGDGSFVYNKDCHLAVGRLVKQSTIKDEQIASLQKVIELKDLALTESTKQTDLWRSTSIQLTDTVNKYESIRENSGVLHFALGVVVTVASVWASGQLVHK